MLSIKKMQIELHTNTKINDVKQIEKKYNCKYFNHIHGYFIEGKKLKIVLGSSYTPWLLN